MSDKKYINERRNRKKNFLRLRLGISQLFSKPWLNILLIPIVALAVLSWLQRGKIINLFNVPQLMLPIFKYSINILVILLPVMLLLFLLNTIGEMTAKNDEADLVEAFDTQDLRNGCPILMRKQKIKGSNVIMREFYSSIPLKRWVEKQDSIEDAMNVHLVEKLKYGKSDGRRIVMLAVKGRCATKRGGLYDEI